MKNVATQAPTTIDELCECELPQNAIKQYGERLITSINAFIKNEKLEQYIDNRPKKKQKIAKDRKTEAANPDSKLVSINTTETTETTPDQVLS